MSKQEPFGKAAHQYTPQNEEDIRRTFTFLNDDDVTYDTNGLDTRSAAMTCTGQFSSPASNSLRQDLLTITFPSEDIPNSVPQLPISNPETSLPFSSFPPMENKPYTLWQAYTYEKCRKRNMNKKRTEGNSSIPDTVIRVFLRSSLLEFLSEYWETLEVNGPITKSQLNLFSRLA
jgi:hypothetical protein